MRRSISCERRDSRAGANDDGSPTPLAAAQPAHTAKQRASFPLTPLGSDPAKTMYTLYYAPGAASMVVHLALLEIGAPYRLEPVDLGTARDPAYLELNPQGTVPALVVDGRVLTESAALLMLLAERHPEARLAPPQGSAARDLWRQWIFHLSNTLAASFRFWFYPQDLGTPEHPPQLRDALCRRIESVWDRAEAQVAAGGPYLIGQDFSGADLYLTMLMRWSRKMPKPATEWPALKALADRVRARASWKELYELEGLSEW